ncbi:MAG: hypothetical protein Q4D28_07640, partial [Prevotellaceae bacterium]|nr:hypothetical protein [Prevotellaceae bacterium]
MERREGRFLQNVTKRAFFVTFCFFGTIGLTMRFRDKNAFSRHPWHLKKQAQPHFYTVFTPIIRGRRFYFELFPSKNDVRKDAETPFSASFCDTNSLRKGRL